MNPNGRSSVVLFCPHASNHIPAEYKRLGLSPADLERHIAWDIGAAGVTRKLAELLDAPAFLGTYSRLLIDLNRPLSAAASMLTRSEDTEIPGNLSICDEDRTRRITDIFLPYHRAVSVHLRSLVSGGRRPIIVGIHSFTPIYRGVARTCHVGVLFEKSAAFGGATLERIQAADKDLNVGPNVPYRVTPEEDQCLLVYGDNAGNPAIELEIRQDLLGTPANQDAWAHLLAKALALDVALDPETHDCRPPFVTS